MLNLESVYILRVLIVYHDDNTILLYIMEWYEQF